MQTSPTQVQRYLSGISYPADKEQILSVAENEGAPEDVLEDLQNLPNRTFDGPTDITRQFAE